MCMTTVVKLALKSHVRAILIVCLLLVGGHLLYILIERNVVCQKAISLLRFDLPVH